MIKEVFLQAIHEKSIVIIKFNSKEKGIIERRCVPFDYGPGTRDKNKVDKYHFYDLNSPSGRHNLSILPDQLLSLELSGEKFEPGEYVTWTPTNWMVKRNWGIFS